MKNKKIMFWAIVLIMIVSIITIIRKPIVLGLDLVGGSRLVLEAQTTATVPKITPDMMDSLRFAIENRVNKMGVNETVVQQTGEKRILIEIPNVSDLKKAKEFLGETAELDFKREGTPINGQPTWISTGLSGKDLSRSNLTTNSSNGEWVVDLEFNDKGTRKFADLTKQLVGKPMAIFFNGELQSAPVIREPIIGGRAQISGGENGFQYEEAKKMVDLLNAGALPVPAKIIEENTVGPTLGADSIEKSKNAALVGLGLVMIFMIAYYKVPGLIADVALICYSLILFALFKTIPVTLTLAGIAGFILSIGMAVDANILIFERTKEELKAGRTLFTAINAGFDRAFTSIFDSNMSTIITCAILYMLGTSVVKGFAFTLALGVLVSMFSAITITKNFMHLIFGTGELKYPQMFGLKAKEIGKAYTAKETKREKAKFGVLD
jgi:preprotein translocase subunit SecD